jgi:mercuric ion transport protein
MMTADHLGTDATPPVAPHPDRGQVVTALGAITAAVLASLCCIGPVLFVTLGVGAGLASRFEPLRPLFSALTVVLLAIGFYTVYGARPAPAAGACTAGGKCTPSARHRRRDRMVFWGATVIALVVLTFPRWSLLLV